MKKIILALVITAFGVTSAAAFACEGMKGHEKAGGEQVKKDGKKEGSKNDQKS